MKRFREPCIECIIKEKSSSGIKRKKGQDAVGDSHVGYTEKKELHREKCACSFIHVFNLNTIIFLYLSISDFVLPRLHLSVGVRWARLLD